MAREPVVGVLLLALLLALLALLALQVLVPVLLLPAGGKTPIRLRGDPAVLRSRATRQDRQTLRAIPDHERCSQCS